MPGPTGITWLDWLIIPALVVLAVGILWRPVRASVRMMRWLYRTAKRIEQFLDAFFGAPARDGQPEQPGVMARLQAEENATGELRGAVNDLTEQIEQQPQHIDQLCEQMQTTMREERQEVIRAALGQHVSAFHHPQPGRGTS